MFPPLSLSLTCLTNTQPISHCHLKREQTTVAGGGTLMDTEDRWTQALASNNVRAILQWLCSLSAEGGDGNGEDHLVAFSSWFQRMAEASKRDFLTICFSRCQGLWMFLDHHSFTKVHLSLRRLRTLHYLAQWGRRPGGLTHPWHGIPAARQACWNQEHRALEQHIWLGQLVQWWGITGLLPKYPEVTEMKRISQMWREMDHNHRRSCLQNPGWEDDRKERWSSVIQGMVAQIDKKHGPLWSSEACTDQCYPPPSLQALLKLVLVPCISTASVQAILMYFILDMAHFLKCKDNLLQSFCHAFTIPPRFSQQIRAFWLLDQGQVLGSMELLLGPHAEDPWVSWQHHCIIHVLLRRKQLGLALKYIYGIKPSTDSPHDLKLCVEVLLQNSHVSEAWALLKKGCGSEMVRFFLNECQRLGLCLAASDCMEAVWKHVAHSTDQLDKPESQCGVDKLPHLHRPTGIPTSGGHIRPFSSVLLQSKSINSVSSEDLITLLRESIHELKQSQPIFSEEVAWPVEYPDGSCQNRSLTPQALQHLIPRSCPEVAMTDMFAEPEDKQRPGNDLPLVAEEDPWRPARLSSHSPSQERSTSVSSVSSSSQHESRSTALLQRVSFFLSEREQRRDRQDDSPSPPADMHLLGCPDSPRTAEGATDPVSFNSLSKPSMDVDETVVSTQTCALVEEVMTGDIPGDYIIPVEEKAVPPVDLTTDRRHSLSKLNLHPQFYSNEDNQSVLWISEGQLDSHNLLTPDYEKMDYCKELIEEVLHAPNETDPWSVIPGGDTEHTLPQTSPYSSAAASSLCFLELEPLQRASDRLLLEEEVEFFRNNSQDAVDQPEILTSCALTKTTDELLSELHHSHCSAEEPPESGLRGPDTERGWALQGDQQSRGSGRSIRTFSFQDSSLLIPLRRSIHSKHLHVHGRPLPPRNRTSISHTVQQSLCSAPETSRDRLSGGRNVLHRKEAACFRSSGDDRLGHCKLGSWWKQALETRRSSSGLLPAMEQVTKISQGKHFFIHRKKRISRSGGDLLPRSGRLPGMSDQAERSVRRRRGRPW
ncbi:hypothetical protein UPYG_G00222360 [Umbra pygmaea]|uniref:ELYS-like domain-containing protein n=1 Tax=Umbra pygmaea TaxID=75934 RepID=A0ABD0WGQ5_UMBPY